jgi:aminoglycoside phosphotransferase (APT) family kinase protein
MTAQEMHKALQSWGDWTILAPFTGGYRNAAFLVEQRGVRRVAKSTRRDEHAMRWLKRVHKAARRADFKTPDLLENADGLLVVEGVTLETFIDGQPPSLEQLETMIPQIEAFHTLTRHIEQRPGFASSLELLRESHGGDVNLSTMPRDLVTRCRAQWGAYNKFPQSVIHGDLNINNVVVSDGQFGLVDWDEARVDISHFDTLVLKKAIGQRLSPEDELLLDTWEIAVCWTVEPAHARRIAQELEMSHSNNSLVS